MKNTAMFCAAALLLAVLPTNRSSAANAAPAQGSAAAARSTIAQSLTPPAIALAKLEDALIRFPLPAGDTAYGPIDGKKMHRYVVELAQISRRYRDAGHPKFWGRLIGTSSEVETNEWLANKYRTLGLTDVRIQPLDLPPQWMPQTWSAEIRQGGKAIQLDSAQPMYYANGLAAAGLDIDAVYVGLGNEADFKGREVRGKAVFIYNMLGMPDEDARLAIKRADAKGAAVIFFVSMLPGNMRYQAYPSGTKAPAFLLGNDDGTVARQLMETSGEGAAPKVKVTLNVEHVPNLKTALVWGTLPGATDETIYVVAHKDGWFDGSSDNGGGVASMLGLAEYFAKMPQAKRQRTLVFIGLDGHHNIPSGAVGRKWLGDHKKTLFAKTALMINDEHPATIQTQMRPRYYPGDEIAWSNTYMPLQWYAGGKDRPQLQTIVWNAFKEFGVPVELDPSPTPPASDMGYYYRFLPGVSASEYHSYFHTDWETPEVVPWTGLEAATRAYAKVIDEVNKLPLSALQRPEDPSRDAYDQ